MPEISIIVPVYNTERFVSKCIESILGQSFEDFELILIDDGSTDQSGDICDKYATKDSRVKAIHQKNRGVSAARNRGLDVAQGNYLYFVDSDDYLESNALEIIYPYFFDSDIDMVCFGFQYRDENSNLIRLNEYTQKVLIREELIEEFFKSPNRLNGSCWNKIFRKEKISALRFDETVSYSEDWIFLFEAIYCCRQGITIPYCLYNVIEREDSITRKNVIDGMYNIVLGFERVFRKVIKTDKSLESLALNKLLDSILLYIRFIKEEAKSKNISYHKYIILLKLKVCKYVYTGVLHRVLPKSKVHRFLTEALNA